MVFPGYINKALSPAANWRLPVDSRNNFLGYPLMLMDMYKWSISKCKLMELKVTVLTMTTSQIFSTLNIKELTSPPCQRLVRNTLRNQRQWPHTYIHQILQENNRNSFGKKICSTLFVIFLKVLQCIMCSELKILEILNKQAQ